MWISSTLFCLQYSIKLSIFFIFLISLYDFNTYYKSIEIVENWFLTIKNTRKCLPKIFDILYFQKVMNICLRNHHSYTVILFLQLIYKTFFIFQGNTLNKMNLNWVYVNIYWEIYFSHCFFIGMQMSENFFITFLSFT